MLFEPIGVFAILSGLIVLYKGPILGLFALAISSLLGAAAAFKLPVLGDASIPPGHILLIFLAVSVCFRRRYREDFFRTLTQSRAALLLGICSVYLLAGAIFLPRMFAGLTYVYSVARGSDVDRIVVSPLGPRASNVTQSLYFAADFVCFVLVQAILRRAGHSLANKVLVSAAIIALIFVAADLATFYTGTSALLSFVRNANYGVLDDSQIGGLKRIVGSYTEASAYAYVALGFFAFVFRLWLAHHMLGVSGLTSLLLVLTIALSTSTTAYVAFALYSVMIAAGCLWRLSNQTGTRNDAIFILGLPPIVFCILAGAMLNPSIWDSITFLFDRTISTKLDSQSGVERMRWNSHALEVFFETWGLGAGAGSVRTSSFAVALVANAGILGAALFSAFFFAVLRDAYRCNLNDASAAVRRAGASACVALLISACVSGTTTDLGIFFFVFAAVAAGVHPTPTKLDVRQS